MARRIVDYIFRTAKDDVGPRFKSLERSQKRFERSAKHSWQGYERTAKRSLSNVSRHGRRQFRQLGQDARSQLTQILGTAALGLAVKKSIVNFANLGSEMTGVAIKLRQPAESLEAVRKELLGFSLLPGITTDAADMAKGVNLLVGADFSLAESLDIVKAAAKGASVAQTSAAGVTSGLADILKGFGIPASRAEEILSKMIVAADKGRVEIPALSSAIGTIIAPAKKAGVGLETVLGLLETLSISGVSNAAEASTSIAALLRRIAKPDFAEKAKKFKIKIFDKDENFRDIQDILGQVKKLMDKFKTPQKQAKFLDKLFGEDIRADRALRPLLDNLDVVRKTILEITNATGRLPEAFAEAAKSTKAKLARLGNIFDVFSIETGSLFGPFVGMLSDGMLTSLNPVKDGQTFADHIRGMIQFAAEDIESRGLGKWFWNTILFGDFASIPAVTTAAADFISDSLEFFLQNKPAQQGVADFIAGERVDISKMKEKQRAALSRGIKDFSRFVLREENDKPNEVIIGGKRVFLSPRKEGESPITEQIRGRIIANAAQDFRGHQQELIGRAIANAAQAKFRFNPKIIINNRIDAATGKTRTEVEVSDPTKIQRREPIGATP